MIKHGFITFILILLQLNCFSQNYDKLDIRNVRIGSIGIEKTTEERFKEKKEFGEPDSISVEINVIGREPDLRNYHFKKSYFQCYDGFVQKFIIRDKGFVFRIGKNSFKVGDDSLIIEKIFPKSYNNPIERNTGFEKLHFEFDKTFYISCGADIGGIKIFCKNGKITGFYNYWMT